MSSEVPEPLPVTIVGGYLGAGKTTLVNHLLRTADGLRLAVLVNDFGALPIDAALIEARDGNVIALTGGCVCCSFGDDLGEGLQALERLVPRPEHVLIEASGVALPDALAAAVGLRSGFAVEAVVVLADAETVEARARDRYMGDTIRRQLAAADLVVLNKTDLVSTAAAEARAAWLATVAPHASVIRSREARLPVALLVGPQEQQSPRPHTHHHDEHTDLYASAHCTVPYSVDARALATLLAESDPPLLRAKGFVRDSSGDVVTIQVVGRRWRVTPASSHVGRHGRLVAIALAGNDPAATLADAVQESSRRT
jgi:G3E family GTPase